MTHHNNNEKEKIKIQYAHENIHRLVIANKSISSIEDNVLADIDFNSITIQSCKKLKRIHKNLFGKKSSEIRKFTLIDISCLTSEPKTHYDLTQLINSLVNCETIYIMPFQNQVEPIKLPNLKGLTFTGKNSLEDNLLTEDSFAQNSLANFKRPVHLYLKGNQIKYLKEEIFKVFFDKNQQNQIFVEKKHFDLKIYRNGKNKWNQKDENYKNRIKFYKDFKHKNNLTGRDVVEICAYILFGMAFSVLGSLFN